MTGLTILTQMPEIKSVVVGDQSGVLSESQNEPDAESIAAVMGFVCNSIKQSGEALGFGLVQKLTVSGPDKAYVLYFKGNALLAINVDPTKPIAAIEKKIEQALQL